ncbi:MAG: preprotein translocase subunit SecE [Verrucomicrobiota bacterium]|jgi:preprotein translocase SecE subunit|nr:preprotein translocase subunit SecE [Verrucomicrobiota bacterium]
MADNKPEVKNPAPKKSFGTPVSDGLQNGADSGPGATGWALKPFLGFALIAVALVVFIWMWRTGKIGALKQYIIDTREQLRKSTWPTRQELKQHIVVVLISSLLLAFFTFAADFLLREIVWGAMMNSKTWIFKGGS